MIRPTPGGWGEQDTASRILKTFDVNVLAHFWTIKAFLPDMLAQKQGHVVNVASLAGQAGTNKLVRPDTSTVTTTTTMTVTTTTTTTTTTIVITLLQVDYCASKFAAVGLDEAFRVELMVQVGPWCQALVLVPMVLMSTPQGHSNYIKTTAVCPYYISTGMFSGVNVGQGAMMGMDIRMLMLWMRTGVILTPRARSSPSSSQSSWRRAWWRQP